jgi:hypothetical protein
MRDEFYGDCKDVLKWTVALRAAEGDKDILYVTMRRPNKNRHGLDFRDVSDADPMVVKFFSQERAEFQSCPSSRSILRLSKLSPRIALFDDPYEHGQRRRYFDRVCAQLMARPSHRPYVILVDPDNGIAGKCPKSEHVCDIELLRIWSAMIQGDVLIVYQHQFRDREWSTKRRSALANAIGSDRIRCRLHDDIRSVCFLEVTKSRIREP